MSLGRCLTDLVANKTITAERAEAMRPVYDELVAQFEGKFGREAAESMATEKAMAAFEADFTHSSLNKVREVTARARITDNATRLYGRPREPGKVNPEGLIAHLVADQHAPYPNFEYRWMNLRNDAHRMMYDLLWEHRANLLGDARKLSDFNDVVLALGGREPGNLNAREFADSWVKVAEYLRTAFNAAGGNIPKLEGWSLPHHWDGVRVGLHSFEEWRADIAGALDRGKMIDRMTGEPMSDFALDAMLRDTYEQIVSEGTVGKEAIAAIGGRSIANRRADHRVLHFAEPGEWLRLNEKYGASDPYGAMMHHVDTMTRDIAAMQILGPNPAATVRWMQDSIGNAALSSPRLVARFGMRLQQRLVEKIWAEITGENRIATRPNTALFFSTIRNWQQASKLGGAAVASIPDLATQGLTTRFNGLPATKAIGAFMREYNPLSAADRDFARRAFLIQEEEIGRMAGFGRTHFEDMQGGALTAPTIAALRDGRIGVGDFAYLSLNQALQKANEVSRRAAQLTLRAGLLNQWTLKNRRATNMEFWNAVTHYAPRSLGELRVGDAMARLFGDFLDRYGVSDAMWDGIRASPRFEHKGTQWILPDQIADREARMRLSEAVLNELDYAVSTGGLRQRAVMKAGRPGELPHEVVSSAGQFLMFPLTVVNRHLGRAWGLQTATSKAGYAAAFLITSTIMGAAAEQLYQLTRGKDPRPMDDSKFWRKAMSRGGGLGYYGDIFDHITAENGRGLSDIGNFPILGSAANWADLTVKQPYLALTGAKKKDGTPKANFLKSTAKVMRFEMPGGNIFWLRTAYERLVLDNLDAMAGNDPGEAAARLRQRARDEGTDYFIPPGTGPDQWRAPNFSNALGNSQSPPPPE